MQAKYNAVMEDTTYLDSLLQKGADEANEAAERTLDNVKQAMGFMPRTRK